MDPAASAALIRPGLLAGFLGPLAKGWRVQIRARGIQTTNKADTYYYDPEGKELRSKAEVARALGLETAWRATQNNPSGDGDGAALRSVDVLQNMCSHLEEDGDETFFKFTNVNVTLKLEGIPGCCKCDGAPDIPLQYLGCAESGGLWRCLCHSCRDKGLMHIGGGQGPYFTGSRLERHLGRSSSKNWKRSFYIQYEPNMKMSPVEKASKRRALAMFGESMIGREDWVYFAEPDEAYIGHITSFDQQAGKHRVHYSESAEYMPHDVDVCLPAGVHKLVPIAAASGPTPAAATAEKLTAPDAGGSAVRVGKGTAGTTGHHIACEAQARLRTRWTQKEYEQKLQRDNKRQRERVDQDDTVYYAGPAYYKAPAAMEPQQQPARASLAGDSSSDLFSEPQRLTSVDMKHDYMEDRLYDMIGRHPDWKPVLLKYLAMIEREPTELLAALRHAKRARTTYAGNAESQCSDFYEYVKAVQAVHAAHGLHARGQTSMHDTGSETRMPPGGI
ncbi:hypothetical protein WJX72_004338 [[Myrmecia] bisecta]|uniref:MBD domain-containing protein n=1 Tax=[Myrmecia] bisecta TaxID=41462 RepID=A0AAW1Q8R3_9CHLO